MDKTTCVLCFTVFLTVAHCSRGNGFFLYNSVQFILCCYNVLSGFKFDVHVTFLFFPFAKKIIDIT